MPFAVTIETDNETIDNPTWEQVEQAIRSLDAQTVTEVLLAPAAPLGPPEGDHHMGIGGGRDGRYVVFVTEDNLHFWNLQDPDRAADKTPFVMTVGGQAGDYVEAQCVSHQTVLMAAREYFLHGSRANGLNWSTS